MARPKERTCFSSYSAHQGVEKSAAFENRAKQEMEKLRVKVAKALEDDVLSLLYQEDHSDMTLTSGGKEVKAHRCIIQARSRHLWQNDWITTETDGEGNSVQRISLPGLSEKQIVDFVRQLYVVSDSALLLEEFLSFFPCFKDGHSNVSSCATSKEGDQSCHARVSGDLIVEDVELVDPNDCNSLQSPDVEMCIDNNDVPQSDRQDYNSPVSDKKSDCYVCNDGDGLNEVVISDNISAGCDRDHSHSDDNDVNTERLFCGVDKDNEENGGVADDSSQQQKEDISDSLYPQREESLDLQKEDSSHPQQGESLHREQGKEDDLTSVSELERNGHVAENGLSSSEGNDEVNCLDAMLESVKVGEACSSDGLVVEMGGGTLEHRKIDVEVNSVGSNGSGLECEGGGDGILNGEDVGPCEQEQNKELNFSNLEQKEVGSGTQGHILYVASRDDAHASVSSDCVKVCDDKENTFSDCIINDECLSFVKSDLSDAIINSYALSIPYETCSTLGRDLLQMYLQQRNCDICLSVDGVKFLAHKCVLAARSSYFSAMLGGRWCESDMEEIELQGVSAQAVEQLLLFLYGGVLELCTPSDLMELFIVMDMYGVDTLKLVLEFYIRKDLCHFFHKPCSACVISASSALNLCHSFYLEELQERCLKWSVKYFTKIWSNKSFASLPEAVHQKCAQSILSTMTEKSVLDVIIECSKVSTSLPRIKWTESILCLTTQLMDSAIEYTSSHFIDVIRAPEFLQWGKVASWRAGSLEEIFNSVIDSLPIDTACAAYQTLVDLKAAQSELEVSNQDILDLLDSMVKRCEKFLRTHIHQVARSKQWASVSKSLQSQILENSSYIHLDQLPDPKPRPTKRPLPASLMRPRPSSAAKAPTRTLLSSSPTSSQRPQTTERLRTSRLNNSSGQTSSSTLSRQLKTKTTSAASPQNAAASTGVNTRAPNSGQRSSFTSVRNHLVSKKPSTTSSSSSLLSSSAPSSSRNATATSSSSSLLSSSINSKVTKGSSASKPFTDKTRSALSIGNNHSSKPKETRAKSLRVDKDNKIFLSVPPQASRKILLGNKTKNGILPSSKQPTKTSVTNKKEDVKSIRGRENLHQSAEKETIKASQKCDSAIETASANTNSALQVTKAECDSDNNIVEKEVCSELTVIVDKVSNDFQSLSLGSLSNAGNDLTSSNLIHDDNGDENNSELKDVNEDVEEGNKNVDDNGDAAADNDDNDNESDSASLPLRLNGYCITDGEDRRDDIDDSHCCDNSESNVSNEAGVIPVDRVLSTSETGVEDSESTHSEEQQCIL